MCTNPVLRIALLTAFAAVGSYVHAQSPNAGRDLAATCFTCHGTNGVSVNNIPPSLAGQNRDYLLQALRDFRDGKRTATVMHQHAKGYTDQQLELIASYFSSVKPSAADTGTRREY